MKSKLKNIKIIVLTVLVTFVVTSTVKDILYIQNHGRINQKILSVVDILDKYSLYEIDEEKMMDYAASAIANSIDDIYTVYYPKTDYTSFNLNISNSYCGIGVVLSVDREKNQLLVSSVIDNSPAETAGILQGDYIVAVNGVQYSGDNLNEAISVIRGDELEIVNNTEVTLSILRENEITDYSLIRGKVQNDSVSEKMITDDIAYIRISAFNSSNDENGEGMDTYDEFMNAINELKTNGMKKLIIDLRSNPGGYLSVVTKIADELLPEGVITYTLSKNDERIDYDSKAGELGIPMVVLVNESSASASEVLTGALQDYNRATVIGERTFGKGVVQRLFEFEDGSGISVTESKYYTPSGLCIDKIGIKPDIEVPFDNSIPISSLPYEDDIQLKRAVECLECY